MDGAKRNLQGSENLDIFKRRHKSINPIFYACDGDLCLVSKFPPGTVAYLDYKTTTDYVTFSEGIQYNEWMHHAPVFIIEGDDPENGPFTIYRYLGANWRPEPPTVNLEKVEYCETWTEFEAWETWIRNEYRKRGGWDSLRVDPPPDLGGA